METGYRINFLVRDRRCYLTRFVLSRCLFIARNELNSVAIGSQLVRRKGVWRCNAEGIRIDERELYMDGC